MYVFRTFAKLSSNPSSFIHNNYRYIWIDTRSNTYFISPTPPPYKTPSPPIDSICKTSKSLTVEELQSNKCMFEDYIWEF